MAVHTNSTDQPIQHVTFAGHSPALIRAATIALVLAKNKGLFFLVSIKIFVVISVSCTNEQEPAFYRAACNSLPCLNEFFA
jgi:hypothetical protein